MRKVTFDVACGLDHYIGREDHASYWLRWGEEVAALSAAYWKTIYTVVVGRKTYEVAVRFGTTSHPEKKITRNVASFRNSMRDEHPWH